jgi:hypothetical protein
VYSFVFLFYLWALHHTVRWKGEVGLFVILSSLFVANECKVTIHVWIVVASVLNTAVPSNILIFVLRETRHKRYLPPPPPRLNRDYFGSESLGRC